MDVDVDDVVDVDVDYAEAIELYRIVVGIKNTVASLNISF